MDGESGKWSMRRREGLLGEGIRYRSPIFVVLLILACILAVFLVVSILIYSLVLLFYVLVAAVILSGIAAYSCFASGMVRTRKVLLGLILLVIVALTSYAALFVLSLTRANWVFVLATDESSYSLGQEVLITVTLENHGFVSHSITSPTSDPVVVAYTISPVDLSERMVWSNPYSFEETTFSVSPGQALVRTYVWNQTNSAQPWLWNATYEAGTYLIEATIWGSFGPTASRLFNADVYINVTAT
jgi:hypothetical protein